MSGFIPEDVKGMFSAVRVWPIVPFCPWRLLSLSPTSGIRVLRVRTLTCRRPWMSSVSSTRSTVPVALAASSEWSVRFSGIPGTTRLHVLPMSTSSAVIRVPVGGRPSVSNL